MKCPNCEKGELAEVNDIVNDLDGYFFVVKGKRCGVIVEKNLLEKKKAKE
ncbi:hypothetical protein HY837_01680 [archaeon]|nr:hypothetical protein [archaeon]